MRAAREQAVRQGLMFAGPNQLLLGLLAAAALESSGGRCRTAGGALEAALGGGDADSVRGWMDEQAGLTSPVLVGGPLRPSDVELTGEARAVLAAAQGRARGMGSRCVATAHVMLALLGSPQGGGAGEADPGSGGSGGGGASSAGRPPAGGEAGCCLRLLLRAAGADAGALEAELVALAEASAEAPVEQGQSYADMMARLRSTYARLEGAPWTERDDEAFRRAGGLGGSSGGGGGPVDDEYE